MTIGGHSDEQCRGVLQGEVEAHERRHGHRGHDWDHAGIPEVKLSTWFQILYIDYLPQDGCEPGRAWRDGGADLLHLRAVVGSDAPGRPRGARLHCSQVWTHRTHQAWIEFLQLATILLELLNIIHQRLQTEFQIVSI